MSSSNNSRPVRVVAAGIFIATLAACRPGGGEPVAEPRGLEGRQPAAASSTPASADIADAPVGDAAEAARRGAAAALLAEPPSDARLARLQALAAEWALADVDAALRWVAGLPVAEISEKRSVLAPLCAALLGEPARLHDRLAKLPEGAPRRAAAALCAELLIERHEGATALAFAPAADADLARGWAQELVSNRTVPAPDIAEWIARVADDKARAAAAADLASRWVRDDGVATIGWLLGGLTGVETDTIRGTVRRWVKEAAREGQVAGVTRWLETVAAEGAAEQALILGYIEGLSELRPDDARANLELLEPGARRLAEQALRVALKPPVAGPDQRPRS